MRQVSIHPQILETYYKNQGESNFHMEIGLREAQKLLIGITISPGLRGTCQNFFSFTIGVVGGIFLEVIAQIY